MFVTMVEGRVDAEREQDLLDAWEEATRAQAPPGLVESTLARSDDGTWRIVTSWESREAVLAMRSAGRPAALVMFERAGCEATVSMWSVRGHLTA